MGLDRADQLGNQLLGEPTDDPLVSGDFLVEYQPASGDSAQGVPDRTASRTICRTCHASRAGTPWELA